jgi:glycosyltransferase involved in cell wall biosynthesis
VERYAIDPARTFTFAFGIDHLFWCPARPALPHDGTVLAIGSDPNRDYATLLQAVPQRPLRLLTDLPLKIAPGRTPIVLRGSFSRPAVTDLELRQLYRTALCVAVPLHDCFQPSGQSVALQAMACGAAVVLTRNRGLWAPDLLLDGENCLLVPPGDVAALSVAVARLAEDPTLRRRLGAAARDTIERYFPLSVAEDAARAIVASAPGLSRRPAARAQSATVVGAA